jgi:hypothetical protein
MEQLNSDTKRVIERGWIILNDVYQSFLKETEEGGLIIGKWSRV